MKEFKKTIKIYKSHKLANNFISITYAFVLSKNCVSAPQTSRIEKIGTPTESLAYYKGFKF
jgi:hypothetical protein